MSIDPFPRFFRQPSLENRIGCNLCDQERVILREFRRDAIVEFLRRLTRLNEPRIVEKVPPRYGALKFLHDRCWISKEPQLIRNKVEVGTLPTNSMMPLMPTSTKVMVSSFGGRAMTVQTAYCSLNTRERTPARTSRSNSASSPLHRAGPG